MLGKVSGMLTAKGLAAVGIAAASLGGGGALLASSHTSLPPPPGIQSPADTGSSSSGSSGTMPSMPSPNGSHGAAVVSAVASCRASASASATHGIGSCVSKVAQLQGAAERSLHAATRHSSNPAGG